MMTRAKIELTLLLVIGISLVFLLPTLQLLPATMRAWRRTLALVSSLRGVSDTVSQSPSKVGALLATPSMVVAAIPADIVSLHCSRLC